ncbi:hypothetical protein [Roseovarius aestuariivivens]|uniref:hypothetical protein n=1 Tax=Roseovarius aestuariivivens TaxID=1888910 RepID=UPI0014369E39|nr:hypothetical protein [Roseovarius aestuariivivens]
METYGVIGLSVITFVIVLFLAARSKKKTQERMADPNAEKSALAKDGDSHSAAN